MHVAVTAKLETEDAQIINRFLFPEFEMVIEEEPDVTMEGLVDGLDGMTADGDGHTRDSLAMIPFAQEQYEESDAGVDKAFLKFQKRTRIEPDQVLR